MLFSFVVSWVLFVTIAFGTKYLFIEESILWIFSDDPTVTANLRVGISAFQVVFSFMFYMILNSIFNSVFFYTLKEINTAEDLITRIHQIKASK